jgi:hypothetical protein
MARKVVFEIEDDLTPAQIQEALPALAEFKGPAREAIDTSPPIVLFRQEVAEPYTYEAVARGVRFYRGMASPSGRGLVVVLAGRHYRPMLSLSLFLQHLPARLFDVLMLFDESNSHYTDGVAGYADSLLSLTQRITADFGTHGYARIYHYGVSSGGLPALRMGLIAGSHRSIAIGGLFQWPINRLEAGEAVVAFDPICACNASRGRNLICVHSSMERDTKHARRVVKTIKARGVRLPDMNEHNILFPLFHAGQLRDFNQRLFGFVGGPGMPTRFVDQFGM